MMTIEIDDEELEAVIRFQRDMAEDADESCEYEEAKRRRNRAKELEKLRKA
jgi:hypothetical protein